jgi:hypothetical protein
VPVFPGRAVSYGVWQPGDEPDLSGIVHPEPRQFPGRQLPVPRLHGPSYSVSAGSALPDVHLQPRKLVAVPVVLG